MSNNEWKARIEVDGIESWRLNIPATITVNFTAGAIITGGSSGATAVVVQTTIGGDTEIIIKDRTGFFEYSENLTDDSGGVGVSNGVTFQTKTPYVNTNPNVAIGTTTPGRWVMTTEDGLISSIEDTNSNINVDNGSGIGSGYSWGFTVKNKGLIEAVNNDGVYFENSLVKYFIDIGDGNGYVQEWGGMIKTFPKIKDLSMQFRCIESTKLANKKFGSSKIPIALNKNLNCKLVYENTTDSAYISKVSGFDLIKDNPVRESDDVNRRLKFLFHDSGAWSLGLTDNFENSILEISIGAGAGSSYRILGTEFIQSFSTGDEYWIYVDSTVDQLIDEIYSAATPSLKDLSLARIVPYQNYYNLSEKEVYKIHTSVLSSTEKALTSTDDNFPYTLSKPDVYEDLVTAEGVQQIKIKSLDSSDNLLFLGREYLQQSSMSLNSYIESPVAVNEKIDYQANINVSINDFRRLIELNKGDNKVYFYFDKIRLSDVLDTPPLALNVSEITSLKITANYKSSIASAYVDLIEPFVKVPVITEIDGNDLVYRFDLLSQRDLNLTLMKFVGSADPISSFTISIHLTTIAANNSFNDSPPAGFDTISGVSFKYINDISIDNLSIGCSGENVTASKGYENVSDTLKYLQTEKAGVDIARINTASYTQAEIDFKLYPNNYARNPAHQIVEQSNTDDIVLDILAAHNLGLFPDKTDKWKLVNWLPKSIVFSDTIPEVAFDDTMWESLGDLTRGDIKSAISDIELRFNYSEAKGEYLKTIRIKNTSASSFNKETCTEGVESNGELELAKQIWILLAAGYRRLKNQSQTVIETKWIKSLAKDGKLNGEAFSFIRNLAGHLNHQLERTNLTTQVNATYRDLDLLSLISINDPVLTEGIPRKGWIEKRVVSWKRKRYDFEILFDLNPKDPNLVRIGKIVKGNYLDIIVNGNYSDKIINGPGNL